MSPIPSDFSNLEITGEYCVTAENKEFLRYDNKIELKRNLVFLDDESLKILSESDEWFMDGTFKSAPVQMSQLFTIHVSVKKSIKYTTLPCVYVLTILKDEKSYFR